MPSRQLEHSCPANSRNIHTFLLRHREHNPIWLDKNLITLDSGEDGITLSTVVRLVKASYCHQQYEFFDTWLTKTLGALQVNDLQIFYNVTVLWIFCEFLHPYVMHLITFFIIIDFSPFLFLFSIVCIAVNAATSVVSLSLLEACVVSSLMLPWSKSLNPDEVEVIFLVYADTHADWLLTLIYYIRRWQICIHPNWRGLAWGFHIAFLSKS